MVRIFHQLRDAEWLYRERIVAYGIVLLAVQIVISLFPVFLDIWTTGTLPTMPARDFLVFYAAGKQADAGSAPEVYSLLQSFKTQAAIIGPSLTEGKQFFFLYPPIFILLCTVLAPLSYPAAFWIWDAASLGFLATALRAVTRDHKAVLTLLSFPTVLVTLVIGQNALLTAALFGWGTYLIDRRPILAGCVLGALCYKPHYFLLVPVALLAARKWHTLTALIVTVSGLFALSVLALGWSTWQAFFSFSSFITQHSFDGTWGYFAYASWFASVKLAEGPTWLAILAQGLAIAAAEIVTALVWYQCRNLAACAATLAAATIVAAPVMVSYDLTLAIVAMAWIYWDARRTGYLPWEKACLALTWILAAFGRNLADTIHFPLLPIIGVVLLAFAVRRSRMPDGTMVAPAGVLTPAK